MNKAWTDKYTGCTGLLKYLVQNVLYLMFTESAEWIGAILMSFLRKYGDQKAAAPVTSDGRPVNLV